LVSNGLKEHGFLPKTIVIAEDDTRIRKLLLTCIARHGYQVTLAPDGQIALAEIRNSMPDLLITDINMPNLDGLSLIKILRADSATTLLPIIAMSADADEMRTMIGPDLVQHFLNKPIELTALCAIVHDLIGPP
jgi:two-component system, chemotaxis family, chemotaxis protein CheY